MQSTKFEAYSILPRDDNSLVLIESKPSGICRRLRYNPCSLLREKSRLTGNQRKQAPDQLQMSYEGI